MRKEKTVKRKMVRFSIPFLVTGIALWGLLALLRLPARAEEQNSITQTVMVVGVWGGSEQASFQAVLDEFTNQTGIPTSYTQSADISDLLLNCTSLGTCPDVALVNNPGLLSKLIDQDALVPLESIIPDFDTYYTATWRTLASVGGTLYAVPFKGGIKSIIWYRPQAFEVITATVPLSWTELLGLSDDLVASGQTPFAIGAESGGFTGWPLSDWFENILLRVGGPEVDRKLVEHTIAWTDPAVVETMQRFGDIVGQNEYQAGGITGTLTTSWLDAIFLVFGSPPSATMYFGGSFIQGIISDSYPSLIPVTDYNFFNFPEIDPAFGKPLMGYTDFVILFHNTSEAQSLVQFLATPNAAEIWVARGGGYLSPNMGVDLNTYPDELSRAQAEQLIGASDFVFDLDDQLPSELQMYIWNALMEYVAHPDQVMSILQGIEDKATELQGLPYKTYMPALMKN
jgi:alpha-glucoside transport system substrate-binding protein